MRLKRVFINILGNAVKFPATPGSVTFGVKQEDDAVDSCTLVFTIQDTGIGTDAHLSKSVDIDQLKELLGRDCGFGAIRG